MPDSKGQKGGGSGSGGGCSRDKWKLRKSSIRPAIQPLFTINEEEEGQKHRNAYKKKRGKGKKKQREVLMFLSSLMLSTFISKEEHYQGQKDLNRKND